MGIIKVISNSFSSTFKKKFNIFALAMIIIISMILSLICVVAFWNPEEKMKNLPVIVVNLDEGQHGADIVDNLKNNDQVKWVFSTDDILSDGIEKTDYYFGFSIPKDFSKSVESAKDGTPIQAEITYHSNMRKNFLLSQFSKNVKSSFDKEVSSSITNKYVTETFDTLYDVESGLTEASDGSGELSDGAIELNDGAIEFEDGVGTLNSGISELNEKTALFEEKMDGFTDGANELTVATASLLDGTEKLHTATSSLSEGTEKLNAGAFSASEGATMLSANIDALLTGITEGSSIQNEKFAELLSAYYQILNSPLPDPLKVEKLGEVYSNLMLLVDGVSSSQTEILSSLKMLSAGGQALSVGAEELYTNIQALNAGTGELNTNTKTLYEAMSSINEATNKIGGASEQLHQGSKSLSEGTDALLDGSNQLNSKAELLTSGTGELKEGSLELHDALSESAEEMNEKLINDSESMGDFISTPVNFESEIYGEVPNYGSGFAPMFLSLGLWVGALMLFFIMKGESSYNIKANSFQLVFGNYITLAIFAVLEALAISICALIIGLEVTSTSTFIAFTIFASLTFVSIMQCLHILFGELISKALCVLAVILQIASSGGTFPVALTNNFFEAVNPYLPFSYTIDGFREILSGGDMQIVSERVISLLIFLIISFVLSVFFCKRISRKRTLVTE